MHSCVSPGYNTGRRVVAEQADGKIVVAGTSSPPFVGGAEVGLARYNPDSSLDSSFGDAGRVRDSFPGLGDITSLALQANGNIVVAGGASADFFLARYNADGTLDTSFDGDGWLTTDFGSSNDFAYSVAVQADGKIVVAGFSYRGDITGYDFALPRYDSSGALDAGFDTDGKVT